jgi:hypothetical protein
MAGMSGNIEQIQNLTPSEGDRNNPNNETISWELYKDYLSGLTTGDTTNDRISYAKKYYHVLLSGNATELLGTSICKPNAVSFLIINQLTTG